MRARSDAVAIDEAPSGEIDLLALRRALGRRKRFIILVTVIVAALAAAYVTLATPRYTAESQLLLENQESFFTRPERLNQGSELQTAADPEAVASQVQIAGSRDIARQAIRDLGLVGNREFDPAAGGVGVLTRMLVLFGLQQDPMRVDPEDRVLETFMDRLTVYSPTKTRVIVIDFQSKDPDLAARVANRIADLYLERQSRAKRGTAREAASSLAELNADLRTKLAKANADVEQFRSQAGLLAGTNNMTISGQQLAELNSELSKARTSQADAAAKVSLIRDMLRHNRIADIPDVANNDLIRRVAEQRVTLRAQLALESRTLLPQHPRIKELNAQLSDLDVQLRALAERTVRALENDAKIAAVRVSNLEIALDAQKKAVGTSNSDEVHLRELERIAQAYKDQLDSSTTKYQEAVARGNSDSTPADARVIARAVPPQVPSYPKKAPILIFATLAALVGALAWVVSAELLGGGSAPIEAAPRPVIVAPAARIAEPSAWSDRLKRFGQSAAADEAVARVEPAIVRPASRPVIAGLDHAAAIAHTTLSAQRQDGRPLRVAALAGEAGMPAMPFLLALGRRLALEGRTIVLDLAGDGESREAVASAAGAELSAPNLSDLLAGRSSFAEVIHRDRTSRLHVIPAGADGLGDDGDVGFVLDAVGETYDAVLLLVAADRDADLRRVASHVDTTFVVGTLSAEVEAIRERLATAGMSDVLLVDPSAAVASTPESVAS